MEMVARHVLSALCRSNMLRLRSDTFSRLLEDLPLTRSAQGSSCLDATIFVDNFSHLSAAEAPAECSKLFVDPQVGSPPLPLLVPVLHRMPTGHVSALARLHYAVGAAALSLQESAAA
jgi:hypothetical protein